MSPFPRSKLRIKTQGKGRGLKLGGFPELCSGMKPGWEWEWEWEWADRDGQCPSLSSYITFVHWIKLLSQFAAVAATITITTTAIAAIAVKTSTFVVSSILPPLTLLVRELFCL